MTLLRRFSILCAVTLLVLAVLMGSMINWFFENNAIEGVQNHLAEHIGHDARRALAESDFRSPKTGDDYEAFWEKLSDILDLPASLLTIVYSPDGTVIWADDDALVGTRPPRDRKFLEALRGANAAELTHPDKGSYHSVHPAEEVLVLHVPIAFGDGTRVVGLIEVHQDIGVLGKTIRRAKVLSWSVLGASFLVLYGLLFGIVRQGSRLIERNQAELAEFREKIESQRIELLARIGMSAVSESGDEPVLRGITDDVRRFLEVPRVTIRLFGAPDLIIESCGEGIPSGSGAFPEDLRGSPQWAFFAHGGIVVVEDVGKHPMFGEEARRPEPARIGAFIAAPLRVQDEDIGLLLLESGEPRAWTDHDRTTAEAVAHQVSIAVRHVRLFQDQQDLAGRLLSLMNNVPGVVYRGLPDWTMPFIGADIERIVGIPAREITRDRIRWSDLMHPGDRAAAKIRIREAVQGTEKVLRLEYRMIHRDGSEHWVADRRQMVYDADGKLAYVDGLCLDITDRKASDEALRLTQFTVDRGVDAIYWINPDGRLIYVNERACRVLGYSRNELLAMTIHDINPNYPAEIWREHWADLRRKKYFSVESFHRARDGRIIPVEVSLNYIEFDGKEYNCATARDISERIRAEDESRRLQGQLVQSQKMEALGILAGGIAHDFNNLLTGILGHADLLVHKPGVGPEVTDVASLIRKAAERASHLTAQLLGFARKGKNLAVPIDVNLAVEDILALIGHTVDKRIVIVRSTHHEPVPVVGDPTQMRQVIMNLAVNGVEAMHDGGELRIATGMVVLDEDACRSRPGAAPGRYARLEVADTGIGIPPKNLGRIFDPFFTTKEQGRGTGLGLAMVFGIVKNHGGFVDVESEVGRGTTFRIHFPAAGAVRAARHSDPRPPLLLGTGKGKVLLVDDQEPVRDVCGAMLTTLGFEVIAASDGREGVERYRDLWREIDLVIVDMIMPTMGGRDAFRLMKEVNPGIRAILSTGYSMEGAVQEIMDEGIAGFIQKPYRLDQLAEVITQTLSAAAR